MNTLEFCLRFSSFIVQAPDDVTHTEAILFVSLCPRQVKPQLLLQPHLSKNKDLGYIGTNHRHKRIHTLLIGTAIDI